MTEHFEAGKSRRSQPLPTRNAVLDYMMKLKGLDTSRLAGRVGLAEGTVAHLAAGRDDLSLASLERLAAALGVSREALEDLLDVSEEIRDGHLADRWLGPVRVSGDRANVARTFGRSLGKVGRVSFQSWILAACVEEKAEKDRAEARQLAVYLRGRRNLVDLVVGDPGLHLWSLAELLCQESVDVVARNPERAADCVEAALAIAERAPGDDGFMHRLAGFCWAHAGNVLRVVREYPAGDSAFQRVEEMWYGNAGADPYRLLDAGRVMGLEASLRKEQGKFAQALRLQCDALEVASLKERPYLLLSYGDLLRLIGDSEGAIRVLEQAAMEAPTHLQFYAKSNIASNLCQLGRYQDAEALLPEIGRLTLEKGSKEYHARLGWLTGRVAAGLGRKEEAKDLFFKTQTKMLDLGLTYDAALVSLDLTKIYLEEGKTATVRRVTRAMAPIFVDAGIHDHAQEALRLFQEAVARDAVSVEFVIEVRTYLDRARRAPGLRFDTAA